MTITLTPVIYLPSFLKKILKLSVTMNILLLNNAVWLHGKVLS